METMGKLTLWKLHCPCTRSAAIGAPEKLHSSKGINWSLKCLPGSHKASTTWISPSIMTFYAWLRKATWSPTLHAIVYLIQIHHAACLSSTVHKSDNLSCQLESLVILPSIPDASPSNSVHWLKELSCQVESASLIRFKTSSRGNIQKHPSQPQG